MALLIGVPQETATGEKRVATVPEVVEKLVKLGFSVALEQGAGEQPAHAVHQPAGPLGHQESGFQHGRLHLVLFCDLLPLASFVRCHHKGYRATFDLSLGLSNHPRSSSLLLNVDELL